MRNGGATVSPVSAQHLRTRLSSLAPTTPHCCAHALLSLLGISDVRTVVVTCGSFLVTAIIWEQFADQLPPSFPCRRPVVRSPPPAGLSVPAPPGPAPVWKRGPLAAGTLSGEGAVPVSRLDRCPANFRQESAPPAGPRCF